VEDVELKKIFASSIANTNAGYCFHKITPKKIIHLF
jgi:hypothetical protein